MYLRFRGENPFISGKAFFRSAANRSMTLAPQCSRSCRTRMSRPIRQYSRTNSRLTETDARNCDSPDALLQFLQENRIGIRQCLSSSLSDLILSWTLSIVNLPSPAGLLLNEHGRCSIHF